MDAQEIIAAKRLIFLLERLSADSPWAHRASGVRGALLKCLSEAENNTPCTTGTSDSELNTRLGELIQAGYDILNQAAREILTPELQEWGQSYPVTGK